MTINKNTGGSRNADEDAGRETKSQARPSGANDRDRVCLTCASLGLSPRYVDLVLHLA